MSDISRTELFDRLDPVLFSALQGATVFCKLRGNPYVELAHWLHHTLQAQNTDLHAILRHFDLSEQALETDLIAALDALPRGASAVSDLSAHIDDAVERAWVYGSLKYGANTIRGAHLILGLLKSSALKRVLLGISAEFGKIVPDILARDIDAIVAKSSEGQGNAATAQTESDGAFTDTLGTPSRSAASTNALQRFGVDLTARARTGKIDPVRGRDSEIRQIVDVLMRRRQNNPLLTGEAGVGKTAVVEGLALRLASGDVPPPLRDVQLWLLDLGLLQAGAGVKGEFEQRLRQVVDAVQSSVKPVILFIDELHTLVGAGGASGTNDAANLLKPMLARGELRTIGATTWSEYKRYIEKDPALTRRFQAIQIDEPDETRALVMLRGVADVLQSHHQVLLLDEAIDAAVRLSHRYIPARQLPDKAVALLDTACARVAISQHAVPAAVEDAASSIAYLETERDIVAREIAVGARDPLESDAIGEKLISARNAHAALTERWAVERQLAEELFSLRRRLGEQAEGLRDGDDADACVVDQSDPVLRDSLLQQLRDAQGRLIALQQEGALILHAVDKHAVAAVVADWTGIPVGKMMGDQAQAVLDLALTLGARVVGQDDAIEAIVQRVQTASARLDDPDKPVGVFLLCGPSGVGKTETALALAESMYGGEQNMIALNMSEFQEPHTVSTLKGAPPGYVGFGEGGVLTEAVRRRPYSVVLLDEIEKAHPDIHEVFFQVFDKGWMEDGEGRFIDFRNTIIILTSNVGTDLLTDLYRDDDLAPTWQGVAQALRTPLLKVFPPAFLGRTTVVPYQPLSDDTMARIVRLQVQRIANRMQDNHGMVMSWSDDAIDLIVARCTESASGGRNVGAILTGTVLPRISRTWLTASVEGRTLKRVALGVCDGDFDYVFD